MSGASGAAAGPVRRRRAGREGAARLAALAVELAPSRLLRVMDVGANPLVEGEVSYRSLLDLGLAEVMGFEPQPEALAALRAAAGPRESHLPHALGDGAPALLRLTRSSGFASVHPPEAAAARLCGFARGMEVVGEIAVETRRLDELGLPRPDFLKIDAQGAELAILRHGRETLGQALAVQIELRLLPIYCGEPPVGDLLAELAGQGFAFLRWAGSGMKHVPLSRTARRGLRRAAHAQAVDGDAFFLRDLRGAEDWPPEALRRLALLAEGPLDSPDLTLFCLEALERRGAAPPGLAAAHLARLPSTLRRR